LTDGRNADGEQRTDNDHRGDRVGDGHERGVKGGRNRPDHVVAYEDGEDEHRKEKEKGIDTHYASPSVLGAAGFLTAGFFAAGFAAVSAPAALAAGLRAGAFLAGDSAAAPVFAGARSEEHTSELQSRENLVC